VGIKGGCTHSRVSAAGGVGGEGRTANSGVVNACHGKISSRCSHEGVKSAKTMEETAPSKHDYTRCAGAVGVREIDVPSCGEAAAVVHLKLLRASDGNSQQRLSRAGRGWIHIERALTHSAPCRRCRKIARAAKSRCAAGADRPSQGQVPAGVYIAVHV